MTLSCTTVSRSYFGEGFKAGSPSYFYTRDHLGSIWEVVGSNGSTIESRVRYSPWGEMTNVSGSGAKADFAFTGHYSDAPNSLALAQHRGYSASEVRWLSRDPLAEVDGPSIYFYVRNDPVDFVDPSGQSLVNPPRWPRWWPFPPLQNYCWYIEIEVKGDACTYYECWYACTDGSIRSYTSTQPNYYENIVFY